MALCVVLAVSSALIIGALWGIYGKLRERVHGFVVAMAGGALIVSAVLELIQPSIERTEMWTVFGFVALGAVVFTGIDYLVDERLGSESGAGLLIAVTLDGVPENLALGAVLIGAEPLEAAALAGSILLANIPEAAGGARRFQEDDELSNAKTLGIWIGTAALLSLAAMAGFFLLDGIDEDVLSMIKSFAAGAIIASLATEIFPGAFDKAKNLPGVGATLGLLLALYLHQLAN